MTALNETIPLSPKSGVPGHRFRSLLRSPSGLGGLVIIALLAVLTLLSFFSLLPFDPVAQDPPARLLPPSFEHFFGTDQFGRDVFSRVAAGVANSALIAVVAVAFAAGVGTLSGLVAGFFRGVPDIIIGGMTNVLFAFPPLLLALSLASVFDRNWFTIAVAIAVVYVPIFIRVTRGPVLSLREIEFVRAATSRSGLDRTRIVSPMTTSATRLQAVYQVWGTMTAGTRWMIGGVRW